MLAPGIYHSLHVLVLKTRLSPSHKCNIGTLFNLLDREVIGKFARLLPSLDVKAIFNPFSTESNPNSLYPSKAQ